ncbi:DUF5655 domain-containing protein [Mucilaginibacter sp. AK015]|uniref:DUF5655 domain-containing protein n=1 Tax=Mucilaginibacter sp. AK015 TaxID=2723072 RepID=UPI001612FD77|nr:DUF5655 domain-containing protein [Mucilaginibacter sp. AK015]MBB5394140.1 hypothetical protein [Mucilaginibacter sp. AK015]
MAATEEYHLSDFLHGKSEHTLALFNQFINQFNTIGHVEVVPLKSMIGLDNGHKRIAYITQLGKNFIHVVFPFKQEYPDNLCFQKIAQVPGQQQFNHHFRMLNLDDVNEEVLGFMEMAFEGEN